MRPDKPGFANRCWDCSVAEADEKKPSVGDYRTADSDLNEARRKTMREMLYRKES